MHACALRIAIRVHDGLFLIRAEETIRVTMPLTVLDTVFDLTKRAGT